MKSLRSNQRNVAHSRKLTLESLEHRRVMATGDLDLSFGEAGRLLLPALSEFTAVAVQEDDKIVAVGHLDTDFLVARFDSDGTLDDTFGIGGLVQTGFKGDDSGVSRARSVVLQDDGKIVVAGTVTQPDVDFAVARLNADGTLDGTFSGDGRDVVKLSSGDDELSKVALQADGKIVLFGNSGREDNTQLRDALAAARYHVNGALDTTFSDDGIVRERNFVHPTSQISGVRGFTGGITPAGKILLVGQLGIDGPPRHEIALAQFNDDGSLDTSFDGDGRTLRSISAINVPSDVTFDANGKTNIVGGSGTTSRTNFSLVRLNADGTFDTTLQNVGIAFTSFGGNAQHAIGVALQSDGKIISVGFSDPRTVSGDGIAVARLNTNGSPDQGFNSDGKNLYNLTPGDDRASGVAVLSDGSILVVGRANDRAVALKLVGGTRPTELNLSNNRVHENQPGGTVVGQLSAVDPDVGDSFSFTLVGGTGATNNGTFRIVGNELQTKSRLNFEVKSSYSVRVRITDSQGNFLDRVFQLRVNDLNDAPVLGEISNAIGYNPNTPAVVIASEATLQDEDSPNFTGGMLTVAITRGVSNVNRLRLGGQYSVNSSNEVLAQGIVIGQMNLGGGIGTANLEITFNENATLNRVQGLLRNIRFRTAGPITPGNRTVAFTITDGDGGTSLTRIKSVIVI